MVGKVPHLIFGEVDIHFKVTISGSLPHQSSCMFCWTSTVNKTKWFSEWTQPILKFNNGVVLVHFATGGMSLYNGNISGSVTWQITKTKW